MSNTANRAFRAFEVVSYQLDLDRQLLIVGEQVNALDPKEISVLQQLIEAAPAIVSISALLSHSSCDIRLCLDFHRS